MKAEKIGDKAASVLDQHVIHPAADIFPMIAGEELDALVEDVKKHGLQEPIWTDGDGAILDGRNRLVACHLAGVKPRMQMWSPGDTGDTPTSFVLSKNLHRRHLTTSQRAAIAVEIEPLIAEEKARMKRQARRGALTGRSAAAQEATLFSDAPNRSVPLAKRRTRDVAAGALGVSSGYVSDAKDLRQAAPEVFEDVKTGRLSLPEAQRQIVTQAQKTGTLDQIGLRAGTVRTVLSKQVPEPGPKKKPKPRITLKKFSKVMSSKVTVEARVTFGNQAVAEEWLNKLQDDPRCLKLTYEQVG